MQKRSLLITLVAMLVVSVVGGPFALADDFDDVEDVAREARFSADIYLLMDTTGSMGGSISGMANDAADLLSLDDDIPDVDIAFGVGDFKDFQSPTQSDPYAFNHSQSITKNTALVEAAIGDWSASGGGDSPEAHLYAYDQLAENRAPSNDGTDAGTIGWRTGAERIVVAMADVAGHDPVCREITEQVPGHGITYDITEDSVIEKFNDTNTTLVAISAPTGRGMNAAVTGFDYNDACGSSGAEAGQAERMTAATGGRFLDEVDEEEIVEAVRDATESVIDEIDDDDDAEPVDPDARFGADVYLLMDTTGSMSPSIRGMANDAAELLTLDDDIPEIDIAFGAGDFKDFQSPTQRDPYAFNHSQGITKDTEAVRAVLNDWSASGGGDAPEAHFYAYDQLAENRAPAWGDRGPDAPGRGPGTIGWREDSVRIVVAMADVAGHDYVCSAITEQVPGHEVDYDITEASVTSKFEALDMTLIAISAPTGSGMDNAAFGNDYVDACGDGGSTFSTTSFSPGASEGQATRMTTATGGRFLDEVDEDEIVEAVREATTGVIEDIDSEDLSPTFDRGITQACSPAARAAVGFTDIGGVSGPIQEAINCLAFYEISQGTTPTTYAPGAEVQRVDMAVFLARLINYAEANSDLVVPPVEDQGFTDIAGLSVERRNAINLLGTLGVTGGTGDGSTYSPFASVTRRDMASFLVRVQNVLEEGSYDTDERFFTDVAEDLPRADDVNALAAQGIVQGVAEGRYGPFRPVLRSQMALFIMRHVDENVEAGRLPAKTG